MHKLLPLMIPNFGDEEINAVMDCYKRKFITMGPKVKQFQDDFSTYALAWHSIMVNSGSSANLLALSVLSNPMLGDKRIKPGDEIISPAVTWSTTINPIIDIGAIPVLCDVGDDYLLDIEQLQENITDKTKAIMPVHLLGNTCDMKAILDIAVDKNLYIIEDSCENLGGTYKGKLAGTCGDFGTFSFYFSHHITTGEGGMLTTNDDKYADIALQLRAHGYVRDSLEKEVYIKKNPEIDSRFLFVNKGFNFRPMDPQGAMGSIQLKKLNGFIEKRRVIAQKLTYGLRNYKDYLLLPSESKYVKHSWFCYGITCISNQFNRNRLMSFLEANGIETRPLVAGNLAEQPYLKMFEHRTGILTNAKYIHKNSFYIGINPEITLTDIDKVIEVFDRFFQELR